MNNLSKLMALSVFISALTLAACNRKPSNMPNVNRGVTKFEKYCADERLSAAVRQSMLFIDAKAMAKSAGSREFLEKNIAFRDLLLGIADPEKALASGIIAPRERVSLYILPLDGSSARLYFTGCVPGLTASEQADIKGTSSAASQFFAGDPLDEIVSDGNSFREDLLASLSAAAIEAEGEASGYSGEFAGTGLMRSLAASRQIIASDEKTLRRIYIITNLSKMRFESREDTRPARTQGLAAGKLGGDLFRMSEVALIQPGGKPVKGQDYLDGFFTGQGARLIALGSTAPSSLPPVPIRYSTFVGDIKYSSGPESVEIIVGDDGKGKLTHSWFILLGSNSSATPMTGSITCPDKDNCSVKSDKGGFAQIWKTNASPEPQWSDTMPLVGARNFSFQIEGDDLTGEVSDERVQFGPDPSNQKLSVKSRRKSE